MRNKQFNKITHRSPLDSDGQLHKHKILNANKSEKNVFQDQSMKT